VWLAAEDRTGTLGLRLRSQGVRSSRQDHRVDDAAASHLAIPFRDDLRKERDAEAARLTRGRDRPDRSGSLTGADRGTRLAHSNVMRLPMRCSRRSVRRRLAMTLGISPLRGYAGPDGVDGSLRFENRASASKLDDFTHYVVDNPGRVIVM